MKNITQKSNIFNVLGINADDNFCFDGIIYYIDNDYTIKYYDPDDYRWYNSTLSIGNLIDCIFKNGYEMIYTDKTKWTKEEIITAKYFDVLGYNYIGKDVNGYCFAFETQPVKTLTGWTHKCGFHLQIQLDMPNIHWEDEEPILIQDIISAENNSVSYSYIFKKV